jgi:phage tail sheath protein FI
MAVYKTPGVYIEEISTLPPSVAQVETAIPAFIGYTMNDTHKGETLVNAPRRIKSFTEFEEIFGRAITTFTITVNAQDELQPIADPGLTFRMNYAMLYM